MNRELAVRRTSELAVPEINICETISTIFRMHETRLFLFHIQGFWYFFMIHICYSPFND